MKDQIQNLTVRNAEEKDIPLILNFIKEIAEYEKLSDAVTADEITLKNSLFGENPAAKVLLAYLDEFPVAFAVYFFNFSTFVGKPGLYLEDVFVKPEFRGKGIGKQILIQLAKIAKENDCGRFEWAVLDWNEPAINFYKSLGAIQMDEWTVFRLSGKALDELAGKI